MDDVQVEYIHDGEWAKVGRLMVYPREDGTFSIGRPDGDNWRDLKQRTGYANMQAAIDHAVFLNGEPDLLERLWW